MGGKGWVGHDEEVDGLTLQCSRTADFMHKDAFLSDRPGLNPRCLP